jgi:hypothetical protein
LPEVVEIVSANPAAKLIFSNFDPNGFNVSLESPSIQCDIRVYATDEISPADPKHLVDWLKSIVDLWKGRDEKLSWQTIANPKHLLDLFKTMVDRWKGWDGELRWEALEGEFGIVATSNSRGHMTLQLNFRENDGPAPWSTDVEFTLETMQVEQAHRQLARFFS